MSPEELFKKSNEIARKKFTRAGLLKIMKANDERCPVCGKPVFYAPHAPEDSSKYACSDIECVNAHGIVDFGLPEEKEKMEEDKLMSIVGYEEWLTTETRNHSVKEWKPQGELFISTGKPVMMKAVGLDDEGKLIPGTEMEFLVKVKENDESEGTGEAVL